MKDLIFENMKAEEGDGIAVEEMITNSQVLACVLRVLVEKEYEVLSLKFIEEMGYERVVVKYKKKDLAKDVVVSP